MTVRQMSAKSAAKAAPAAEEELPKGLISSFYKLKGDQKLYQVRIYRLTTINYFYRNYT